MKDAWRTGTIRGAAGAVQGPVVIKFGGSLLARGAWPGELRAVLSRFTGPVTVVVGGGRIVDELRALDAVYPLPVATSHRLAIDAMGITARLVAEATHLPLVVEPAATREATILDVPAWLAKGDRLAGLPEGWHVTSDSIAAFVAATLGARLVLAKSVPPPPGELAAAAAAGWVDEFFPVAASGLSEIAWIAPPAGSP